MLTRQHAKAIFQRLWVTVVLVTAPAFARDQVSVHVAHNSRRELETWSTLQLILGTYDLHKYTFTREVIIQERSINHAFPVLTLNVFFGDRPDDLLSTYIHEQLHWYLREHDAQQKAAIRELHQLYPRVPAGLPEGADSEYSTYGHLVDWLLGDSSRQGISRAKADRQGDQRQALVHLDLQNCFTRRAKDQRDRGRA